EQLSLNAIDIPSDSWTVNSQGTELSFSLAVAQEGLYSLHASQGGQTETLPSALLVAEALSVSAIQTEHAAGSDRVSDSGGTLVTISGSGFKGDLTLHWFESNAGHTAAQSNKIAYSLSPAGLEFVSPATEPGRQYQVVLQKPFTGEEISVPALLTSVDDTRPVLNSSTGLSYATPVSLVFNEAMQATGFSVSEEPLDYSGGEVTDVSARFELLLRDNIVKLRLLPGQSLLHNRTYHIEINGISDLNGNQPSDNWKIEAGIYSATYTTKDTLAPRNITLVRASDEAPVNSAMLLTRGRSYTFIPAAIDNRVSSDQLSFEVRISTDGGLSFGPPTRQFTLSVRETDGNLAFRVKARDNAGNITEARFDAATRDPVINLSSLYTVPTPVEEMTPADIRFDLDGDVDLIREVRMRVLGKWYPVTFQPGLAGYGTVSLPYLNPKLADITGSDVSVRLQVDYGFSKYALADDSYPLLLDATPPTLSIVSPDDGDGIELGEPTDVLIQSFDRYGIERIEVQINGGGYNAIENPNRYTFTAETTDPVLVEARAWDPNNNVSAVDSVTLVPYDPSTGEPVVDLVGPDNGSVYHEGEDVTLEVVMRNVTSADLYFDFGGIESETAVATITREDEDPQRFAYTTTLPLTDSDAYIVVRLQSGELAGRRFLKLLQDDGIDQDVALTLSPAAELLTGSELWIDSAVPDGMDDFADDSLIEVYDPATGTVTDSYAMNIGPRSLTATTDGDELRVDAILRDRSHHQKTDSRTLLKHPYLGDTLSNIYTPSDSNDVVSHMLVAPGLKAGADNLIWSVNRRGGGYRIMDVDGVIASQTSGYIDRLFFTGGGLLAQETRGGDTRIIFWPIMEGELAAPVSMPLLGELLGGNGDLFYLLHGGLVEAVRYVNGGFLPYVGLAINETLRATQVDRQRLLVLTESGLYGIQPTDGGMAQLKQHFFTALAGQEAFQVDGDRLVVWNSDQAQQYSLEEDGTLTSGPGWSAGGEIQSAQFDGELLWMLAHGPYADQTWQAWRDGELIGLLGGERQALVFDGGYLYELLPQHQAGEIQRRDLIAASVTTALTPVLTETPLGVLIGAIEAGATLGGDSLAFHNEAGQRLPAESQLLAGVTQWFIPRDALSSGVIQVTRTDRGGNTDQAELSRTETSLTSTLPLTPLDGTVLSTGARVPVTLPLEDDARVESQALDVDGVTLSAGVEPGTAAYQWLQLPDVDGTVNFSRSVDGVAYASGTWTLQANDPAADMVIVSQPASNQSYTEGDDLIVNYRVSEDTPDTFRYAEISLFDFNRQLLSRHLSGQTRGRLTLRMPAVTEQENLFVRVRGYYDETYRYSEAEVGVRLFPELKIPALTLEGVGPRVMAGSDLDLQVGASLPAGVTATIEIYDGESLLAAGDERLDFTVPDAVGSLRIVTTVRDEYGNERSTTQSVQVVDPLRITLSSTSQPYAAALPDIGAAWFGVGRNLVDLNAQTQATLESDITAIAHLGDRLLLALNSIGLVILDPADEFRVLTTHALSGEVTRLAVNDDRAIAIIDGRPMAFLISGNAIEQHGEIDITGTALDVRAWNDNLLVLSDRQLLQVDADLATSHQLNGDFTAMTHYGTYLYVSAADGKLHRFDQAFGEGRFAIGVDAERLLTLQGDLLALSGSGQMVQIIDVRDSALPRLIGRLPLALEASADAAMISAGKLWLGGTLGAVFDLVRPDQSPELIHETARPRGSVASVALNQGTYLAAADNYGAMIYTQDEAGVIDEQVYPSPYAQATTAVDIHAGSAYLLQPDFQQIVALDAAGNTQVILSGYPYSCLRVTDQQLVASAGDRLHLALRSDPGVQDSLVVDSGDEILALEADGERLYVGTAAGGVYEISTVP
ncbi:MAG: Ig-like domain-containing protein, partial [Candidatus Thiodiazotropha sp.]